MHDWKTIRITAAGNAYFIGDSHKLFSTIVNLLHIHMSRYLKKIWLWQFWMVKVFNLLLNTHCYLQPATSTCGLVVWLFIEAFSQAITTSPKFRPITHFSRFPRLAIRGSRPMRRDADASSFPLRIPEMAPDLTAFITVPCFAPLWPIMDDPTSQNSDGKWDTFSHLKASWTPLGPARQIPSRSDSRRAVFLGLQETER